MLSIDKLEDIFIERGFLASFLVVSGWLYVLILLVVLVFNLFQHILRDKKTKTGD